MSSVTSNVSNLENVLGKLNSNAGFFSWLIRGSLNEKDFIIIKRVFEELEKTPSQIERGDIRLKVANCIEERIANDLQKSFRGKISSLFFHYSGREGQVDALLQTLNIGQVTGLLKKIEKVQGADTKIKMLSKVKEQIDNIGDLKKKIGKVVEELVLNEFAIQYKDIWEKHPLSFRYITYTGSNEKKFTISNLLYAKDPIRNKKLKKLSELLEVYDPNDEICRTRKIELIDATKNEKKCLEGHELSWLKKTVVPILLQIGSLEKK